MSIADETAPGVRVVVVDGTLLSIARVAFGDRAATARVDIAAAVELGDAPTGFALEDGLRFAVDPVAQARDQLNAWASQHMEIGRVWAGPVRPAAAPVRRRKPWEAPWPRGRYAR